MRINKTMICTIGKQDAVLEAKREILKRFQTQSSSSIDVPKEYHGFILGKGGAKLKELERITATKITIPKESEPTGRIVVTGPKEGSYGNLLRDNIKINDIDNLRNGESSSRNSDDI